MPDPDAALPGAAPEGVRAPRPRRAAKPPTLAVVHEAFGDYRKGDAITSKAALRGIPASHVLILPAGQKD